MNIFKIVLVYAWLTDVASAARRADVGASDSTSTVDYYRKYNISVTTGNEEATIYFAAVCDGGTNFMRRTRAQ